MTYENLKITYSRLKLPVQDIGYHLCSQQLMK